MASCSFDNPSIVEWFGEQGGHRCGYCKQKNTNHSHGMWAHSLTVQDYQDLIDRGWRRSGKYCYKPTMKVTCCPHYAIRCDTLNFKLNKSHKKLLKKVNRYLITGDWGNEGSHVDQAKKTKGKQSHPATASGNSAEKQMKTQDSMESSETNTTEKKSPRKGDGPDPNKPPCKKAKLLRMEKKVAKLAQKSKAVTSDITDEETKEDEPSGCAVPSTSVPAQTRTEPKSIEDYIDELSKVENPAHKLEVKLVRSSPRSPEFDQYFEESHAVYKKYQIAIHKDPSGKPNVKQYTRFLVDSPLTQVRLVRSSPQSKEYKQTEAEAYNVYRKYQMTIHKDSPEDCAKHGYAQFLVDSPLQPKISGELKDGYGSFHQLYILDGRVIAVGVVDILPSCMSSVYMYYDPDYEFLSLGTYTALREVAFTRLLKKSAPELKYYYMGYYIHSCPKMKYKGQYVPSFLSCPEVYTWQPIEKCRPKLDQSNYSRLDEDATKKDEDGRVDVSNVLILTDGEAMDYDIYRQIKRRAHDEDEVRQYAGFVGRKCYQRMLLFRK